MSIKKIILIIGSFILAQLHAVVIYDIDETDVFANQSFTDAQNKEHTTTSRQLRVIEYNVEEQKYENIIYYLSQNRKVSKVDYPNFFEVLYEYQSTGNKLHIKLTAYNPNSQAWILIPSVSGLETNDKIIVWDFEHDKVRTSRKLVLPRGAQCYDPTGLINLLRKFELTTSDNSNFFEAELYSHNIQKICDFELVGSTNFLAIEKKKADIEKGMLGEIATDLTFFSHGFIKHVGKYKGENGLDGSYTHYDLNHRIVYVTESKFQAELWSREDFRQVIGVDSLIQKIRDNKINEDIKDAVEQAINEKRLVCIGQTYLRQGIMKSAYIHLGDGQIDLEKTSFNELRQVLTQMKYDRGGNAAKLHEDLMGGLEKPQQASYDVLREFINGITSSPRTLKGPLAHILNTNSTIKQEFNKVCQQKNLCCELFPLEPPVFQEIEEIRQVETITDTQDENLTKKQIYQRLAAPQVTQTDIYNSIDVFQQALKILQENRGQVEEPTEAQRKLLEISPEVAAILDVHNDQEALESDHPLNQKKAA